MLPHDRDPLAIPPTSDPPGVEVALVRWPEEEATRRQLMAARLPRLLLLDPGAPPPVSVDDIEDWVRLPCDPEELDIRIATLARRAADVVPGDASLRLDDDSVLHRGTRWVALPPMESRLVALLLDDNGKVVHRPELIRAAWPDGPPTDERALDGLVKRLRRRVAPLGVRIHTVTGRGFLLDTGAPSQGT